MALDTKLTQNINLRANGDQLLGPMRAFGREINKAIEGLNALSTSMTKGGHKSEDTLRAQVQLLQRLVGEASTLQNILTSAGNRKRDALFSGLDEQSVGRKAASASKLKRELETTKSAADALDVRLAQLYRRFGELAQAGRKVGERDLSKAYNTEQAIKQVRRLEQELQRLDNRQAARGKPMSADLSATRAEVKKAQETLLEKIKSPNRVNWGTEISSVELLIGKYRQLALAEGEAGITAERAQAKIRGSVLNNVNQSEAMLRAQLERGAGRYRFTNDQARTFNMPALGRQIDENVVRLGRLRDMMSKAVEQNRSPEVLGRLAKSWQTLIDKMGEATAMQRAFNNLPEQRAARSREAVSSALFGDGGMAFGKRMFGAAALGTVAFGAINAVQGSARYVLELEDAMKQLQAIAGATNPEMQALANNILDVSQNSKFSTIEITKAATAIAQAGFSSAETGIVLKDALALATGSGSTPAEAVDTLTSALGAFQLQASESSRITDVMVEGLNRSKLSINQLQAAIQYAGATANENGIKFEELTAIAGSLANAGIRSGSTIGTGLRQMLVDLKNPTEDFKTELQSLGLTMADVDVKSKGLAGVVKTLTDAGFSAEAAYASFEVRAASAFLAFKGQLDTYDELSLALARGGAAAEAQATAMDSLSAKWQKFLNQLGTGAAAFSEPFMAALKTGLDAVSGIIEMVGSLAGMFGEASSGVGTFFQTISSGAAVAGAAFLIFAPLGPIVGGIAAVIGGLLGMVGALRDTNDNLEELQATSAKAEQELDSQQQTVRSVDEALSDMVTRADMLTDGSTALAAQTITLTQKFAGLSSELKGTKLGYDEVYEALQRLRGAELQRESEKARAVGLAKQAEQAAIGGQYRENSNRLTNMSYAAPGNKDPRITRAIQLGNLTFNGNADSQTMVRGEVAIRAAINDLQPLKKDNEFVQDLIGVLQERLSLFQRLSSAATSIRRASETVNYAAIEGGAGGQQRRGVVLGFQREIDKGLLANERQQGSGDAQLTAVKGRADAQLARYRVEMGKAQAAGNTALFRSLEATVRNLEGLLGRIARARRIATEEAEKANKGDKNAEKGSTLPAAEVGRRLQAQFPGIGISFARQRKPGDRFYKSGSYHAKPGGQAIDIASLPKGVSWDNVAAAIEGMGLELTQAPSTTTGLPGVTKLPLNHGSGPHGHFAWGAKTSKFQRDAESEAEKEAKELLQLQKQRGGYAASEQQKRIQAIINEAKAGSRPVTDLNTEIGEATSAYRKAKLSEFDTGNPTDGLSATMLKARNEARAQLEQTLGEEVRGFYAQFVRQIADSAKALFESAEAAIEREQKNAGELNEQPVRAAENRVTLISNPRNRGQFGDGARYRAERQAREAGLVRDQANLDADSSAIIGKRANLAAYEASTAADVASGLISEGSPEWLERQEMIRAKTQEITDAINARNAAQAALNAQTQEFTDIPLGDRLRESVAAWAENSGAMDTWKTTLENSIGPALDLFTSQLSDMFSAISDGSKTVKQSMLDFVSAFTRMVVQIITKALALMAVKAILGAFGLQLNNGAGGVSIGKRAPKGQMTGGPAGEPRKFMKGGTPQRGYISEGVSNRDGVPALLARKEYVVRGSSVESLGLPFMDAINRHGAKALTKMAGVPVPVGGGGRQEMNVWMVRPEEQPQLGPNDIKMVIADDILQGGQTKQLIKRVMQGA